MDAPRLALVLGQTTPCGCLSQSTALYMQEGCLEWVATAVDGVLSGSRAYQVCSGGSHEFHDDEQLRRAGLENRGIVLCDIWRAAAGEHRHLLQAACPSIGFAHREAQAGSSTGNWAGQTCRRSHLVNVVNVILPAHVLSQLRRLKP